MHWTKGFGYASLAVSGLILILAIVAKVSVGEIAGFSPRALYALAMVLGVYSAAFSLLGGGRGAGS